MRTLLLLAVLALTACTTAPNTTYLTQTSDKITLHLTADDTRLMQETFTGKTLAFARFKPVPLTISGQTMETLDIQPDRLLRTHLTMRNADFSAPTAAGLFAYILKMNPALVSNTATLAGEPDAEGHIVLKPGAEKAFAPADFLLQFHAPSWELMADKTVHATYAIALYDLRSNKLITAFSMKNVYQANRIQDSDFGWLRNMLQIIHDDHEREVLELIRQLPADLRKSEEQTRSRLQTARQKAFCETETGLKLSTALSPTCVGAKPKDEFNRLMSPLQSQ